MPSLKHLIDLFEKELSNNFKNEYKNRDYFYLKGQLKMSVDDNITYEKIEEAKRIDLERQKEYGGPANFHEVVSMQREENLFQELLSFLDRINYTAKSAGKRK